MKSLLFVVLTILLLSCDNDPALDQCKTENERLISENAKNDSIMHSLTNTYKEIDSVSALISDKKGKINTMAKKGKLSAEDKKYILAEMDTINSLLEINRNKVSALEGHVNSVGLEEGFKYMVQSMEDKNSNEDFLLGDMKKDLAQVSKDFSDLFEDYVYKEAENMEMKEKLSSAAQELQSAQAKLDMASEKLKSGWYIIGTNEELRAKGLVYKDGLFSSQAVNEDFDRSQFKKIDIFDLKEIMLDAKKARIMTTHPTEAYEFVGIKKAVNKLVIKNPEQFWSVSKFLIIEIEK